MLRFLPLLITKQQNTTPTPPLSRSLVGASRVVYWPLTLQCIQKGKNAIIFYKMCRFIVIILVLLTFSLTAEPYTVRISGINEELAGLFSSVSQLVSLQETPPSTRAGIKRRAEADIPRIVHALHSHAYYNARVEVDYDFDATPLVVNIAVDSGPVYPLESFFIVAAEGTPELAVEFDRDELGVELGAAATPSTIVQSERQFLKLMDCYGYPFAQIKRREVAADQMSKTVRVTLFVDSGPLAYFGPTSVTGAKRVRIPFFEQKIAWCEGEVYSPGRLAQTQRALERTVLFNNVSVDHAEALDEEGRLPIHIHVKERKPRSIGLGINYASQRGPGVSGEWEHRNFMGMGETLSFRTNLWSDLQDGRLSYLIPDYGAANQDLIWLADCRREVTEGYVARSVSLSALIDRRYNKCFRYSHGLMYKHLLDSDIHEKKCHQSQRKDEEGFNLAKIPINLYWNQTNNVLDPTHGYSLRYKNVPSWNFTGAQFIYDINVLTVAAYQPLDAQEKYMLAGKGTFGSIFGAPKQTIPRSELFDAGTDDLLRGYKYMTVSPVDNEGDPTGGRSMMIYSFELRARLNKQFGVVGFYDVGNVYNSVLPDFGQKLLNSVGVGVRYFTPVGPLRLDVAFPLNFRRHTDSSHYQVYLSIGQTF